MALSMKRIGWQATGPFTFIDDQMVARSFVEASPKLIQVLVAAAHNRLLEGKAAKKLGWQRHSRVYTEHIRAYLKGDLPALQEGIAKAFLCSADEPPGSSGGLRHFSVLRVLPRCYRQRLPQVVALRPLQAVQG